MDLRKHLKINNEPHSSALNDILFILLFFFLIISTLANPNVIKLTIPQAKSDTKAKQSVVVSIDSLQKLYVGTVITPSDSLVPRILQAIKKNSQDADPTVVINADKKAQAESIVLVMQSARAAHLKTVLAVAKE